MRILYFLSSWKTLLLMPVLTPYNRFMPSSKVLFMHACALADGSDKKSMSLNVRKKMLVYSFCFFSFIFCVTLIQTPCICGFDTLLRESESKEKSKSYERKKKIKRERETIVIHRLTYSHNLIATTTILSILLFPFLKFHNFYALNVRSTLARKYC